EQKMCENAWEMGQWCEWKNGTCDFINCSSISNSTKCIEVPHCEWNETYCYEISCAVFDGNQTACESAFDNYGIMCEYNPLWGLCDPMEFGGCMQYTDNATCSMNPPCFWVKTQEGEEFCMSCEDIYDPDNLTESKEMCNSISNCVWDENTQMCYTNMTGMEGGE
ncbi:MAG: hypothetical protein J7J38_03970, partial [Candidatus Aenigmarchaeota archaeon]|nr:hypothetical protein [Candidatus Aenigmarchaeota archaeon]